MAKAIGDFTEERLLRQQALADAMRKQALSGSNAGSGYQGGRVFMVGNQLGNLAQAIGGAYLGDRADTDLQALQDDRKQQRSDYLATMPSDEETVPQYGPTEGGGSLPDVSRLKSARQQADDMRRWSSGAANVPGLEGIANFGLQQSMLAPEKRADRELQGELAQNQLLVKSMEARQARAEADARRLESDRVFKMTAQTQEELRRAQIDALKEQTAAKAATAQVAVDAKKQAADDAKAAGIDLAQQQINNIDEMIGTFDPETGKQITPPHAGFPGYVGATYKPFARNLHGTNEADFDLLHKQVTSQARLEGIKAIKGTGSVSNAEGAAAAAAITRMNSAASETEYAKAAREYRDVMKRGIDRQQRGITVDPSAPLTGYEKFEKQSSGGYEKTKTIPGKGTFGLRNGQWFQVQ